MNGGVETAERWAEKHNRKCSVVSCFRSTVQNMKPCSATAAGDTFTARTRPSTQRQTLLPFPWLSSFRTDYWCKDTVFLLLFPRGEKQHNSSVVSFCSSSGCGQFSCFLWTEAKLCSSSEETCQRHGGRSVHTRYMKTQQQATAQLTG